MSTLVVVPANVKLVSGNAALGTLGETVTAGQPVYLDAATKKLKKALATSDVTADVVGVSLAYEGRLDQQIGYAIAGCTVNLGCALVAGQFYVVGGAAGDINPITDSVAGWRASVVGYAVNATDLLLTLEVSGVTHG